MHHHPEQAQRIQGFEWVQDGLSGLERKTIDQFAWMAGGEIAALDAALSMPWVQDGLSVVEAEAIDYLEYFSQSHSYGNALLAMPFLSTVEASDAAALKELGWLAYSSDKDFLRILEHPTLEGGITDQWAKVLSTVTRSVEIDTLEALLATPWVQDGFSTLEAEAVDHLDYLERYHAYAETLLTMPFLSTVEAFDVAALKELRWLAYSSEEDFLRIMAYPALDDGITDHWAMVLSTVQSVANTDDPDLLDDLLSPSKVSVEASQIHLPFTGTTDLALIRVDVEGSDESMGLLVDVLTELDSIMAASLPRAYVGVLSADGGWFGHSAGTHIAIDPKYDENPQTGYGLRHLFMHEIGHYFWRGNRPWIDEGIANTLSDLFELKTTGRNTYLERNFDGCDKTIEDLDVEASNSGICHYHLGTPLFMELSWGLGEARFHEALRNLYALSLSDGKVEVGHVRRVFSDVAEDADAVEEIIDRWYYGPE